VHVVAALAPERVHFAYELGVGFCLDAGHRERFLRRSPKLKQLSAAPLIAGGRQTKAIRFKGCSASD
jgi:hypothetical protein